ncbi:MAG: hypothetical protein JRN52_02370 [Nitrososphaerota archaeon]|nr:hypothetical protein [Nitrososphaerota archaeon]
MKVPKCGENTIVVSLQPRVPSPIIGTSPTGPATTRVKSTFSSLGPWDKASSTTIRMLLERLEYAFATIYRDRVEGTPWGRGGLCLSIVTKK